VARRFFVAFMAAGLWALHIEAYPIGKLGLYQEDRRGWTSVTDCQLRYMV
jgi:hypothetical protein